MNSPTEIVVLNGHQITVPLRYDGNGLNPDTATATQICEARQDRGFLIYSIGMRGSNIFLPGAPLDVRRWHERKLDAEAASRLARLNLRAGPTVFFYSVANVGGELWTKLLSLTPVLVPDRMHMEELTERLYAAGMTTERVHAALLQVLDLRHWSYLSDLGPGSSSGSLPSSVQYR